MVRVPMSLPTAPLPSSGDPTRSWRPEPRRPWYLLAGVALSVIVVVCVVVWWLLPRPHGWGFWFPLGGFFVIFLVLWLAFAAVRMAYWRSRRDRYRQARAARFGGPAGFDPALRVARMRYARGEISREQYEQIVQGLRPGGPSP